MILDVYFDKVLDISCLTKLVEYQSLKRLESNPKTEEKSFLGLFLFWVWPCLLKLFESIHYVSV